MTLLIRDESFRGNHTYLKALHRAAGKLALCTNYVTRIIQETCLETGHANLASWPLHPGPRDCNQEHQGGMGERPPK